MIDDEVVTEYINGSRRCNERRKGERLKIRMDRRAEKDVEANSKKRRLKWTVRGQLLALGGFSSGHQASHRGDVNATMTTGLHIRRYTDAV